MSRTGIAPAAASPLASGQAGAIFGWIDADSLAVLDESRIGEIGAAGNVYSTVEDMAVWVSSLHAGKVLSEASYEQLVTVRKDSYALGWDVAEPPFGRLLTHSGAFAVWGFHSIVAYLPSADLTVVLLSNRPLGFPSLTNFAGDLLRRATGSPPADRSPPSPAWQQSLLASAWSAKQVALILLCSWGVVEALRRPEKLWLPAWLSRFHLCSFVVAFMLFDYQSHPWHPLLLAWAALTAGGAVVRGWLPDVPRARPQGMKAWLEFALDIVVLCGLLLLFTPTFLLQALLLAVAVQAPFIALRFARLRKSASEPGEQARAA